MSYEETILTPNARVEKKQNQIKKWLIEIWKTQPSDDVYYVAVANNYSALETFIYFNVGINYRYYSYILLLAIFYNNNNLLSRLLQTETTRMKYYNIPVHLAIMRGNLKLVDQLYELVKKSNSVQVVKGMEKEIFIYALCHGQLDVIKYAMKRFKELPSLEQCIENLFWIFKAISTVKAVVDDSIGMFKPLLIQLNRKDKTKEELVQTVANMLVYILQDTRFSVSESSLSYLNYRLSEYGYHRTELFKPIVNAFKNATPSKKPNWFDWFTPTFKASVTIKPNEI